MEDAIVDSGSQTSAPELYDIDDDLDTNDQVIAEQAAGMLDISSAEGGTGPLEDIEQYDTTGSPVTDKEAESCSSQPSPEEGTADVVAASGQAAGSHLRIAPAVSLIDSPPTTMPAADLADMLGSGHPGEAQAMPEDKLGHGDAAAATIDGAPELTRKQRPKSPPCVLSPTLCTYFRSCCFCETNT
jgi:hypothetical protein